MTDLGHSGNEDTSMATSCRTVEAYRKTSYPRYEKVR